MWHIPYYSIYADMKSSKSLFRASINSANGVKWGFINSDGIFIIQPQYDDVRDYNDEGFAIVSAKNKYGLINTSGDFIVKLRYNSIESLKGNLFVVVDNDGSSLMNSEGVILTKKHYDFISDFYSKRAVCSYTKDNISIYGYLDTKGNEVIPCKYTYATEFHKKKAVVKKAEYKYELIDTEGAVINNFDFYYLGKYSQGLMAFQENDKSKYGYIDENKKIKINPQYIGAQPFENSHAVVGVSNSFNKYGLIDTKGRFTIKPEFSEISYLGKDRYSVGTPKSANELYLGSKYQLYNSEGIKLVNKHFDKIYEYKGILASVCDMDKTYFINTDGKKINSLPLVVGCGQMQVKSGIVEVENDMKTYYTNYKGDIIYKQNIMFDLNEKYSITEKKYKPNENYLVYYPKVKGISNETTMKYINEKLAEFSYLTPISQSEDLEYNYFGNFEVDYFKKRLLVLKFTSYKYFWGAAHGMPTMSFSHCNLISGSFYKLSDLFISKTDYKSLLGDIIRDQIKNSNKYDYVWPDSKIEINDSSIFSVDSLFLKIYFQPYEIAPYAAGFPEFKISYDKIIDIINKSGEFWEAYH